MLPFKLKNFNLFNDGGSYLGIAGEIELPKLVIKTEQWRGGGMLGEVDIDMGLEKLEMTVKYGGLVVPILRQFGVVGVDGVLQRFVGAFQEEGDGAVSACEIVTRGKHVEIDMGTAKPGEGTEHSVKSTLAYYRMAINGADVIEIDMLTGLFVVGGVDRTAALRAALQI